MVGDGVLVLKDDHGGLTGPLLAGFWVQGPDFESARPEELESLSRRINQAFRRLDSGWMLHFEAVRRVVHDYDAGKFPEPIDQLLDDERAAYASYYATECALFVTQAPSLTERSRTAKRAKDLFLGITAEEVLDALGDRVARFEAALGDLTTTLGAAVSLRRMRYHEDGDELLEALQLVINGERKRCRLPANPVHLDVLLARDVTICDDTVLWDGAHVAVVGLHDLPAYSTPGLLLSLTHLGVEFRWSTRFIVMDYREARSELQAIRRKWYQKTTSLSSQVLGTAGPVDRDAVARTDEVDEALSDLEGGHVKFGHYTSVVLVRGSTRDEALSHARVVVKALEATGFEARVESLNAFEALLGSIPGHGVHNVRKPLLNTLNLADLLCVAREWAGARESPNPFLPPRSASLLQARTWSGARFDLNLHIDDLGHTLVLGPPGAGKSTLLGVLCSQFLRYRNAQVVVFDKGFSILPLALAHQDGRHYALGAGDGPSLCPLAEIDTDADRAWAAEWIEGLLQSAGLALTPAQLAIVGDGIAELAASTFDASQRTLTHYLPHVQDTGIREALRYYASGVGSRILNGESNAIERATFTTFELEDLMSEGGAARERVLAPTLMYLFHLVEKRLDGRPTLLVIDEAWTQLSHPRFAEKLRAWLKTMRKANCAVVMATQSLSDVTNSPIADAVFESCPTRILLPNEAATTDAIRPLYAERLQLTNAQIEVLARAERKRWYMVAQGARSRLFSLDLGQVALSFVGASSREDRARVLELYQHHGAAWPEVWLEERGLGGAAERLVQLRERRGRSRHARIAAPGVSHGARPGNH